ncbi:MAG: nuclear transport factor 2 family protein [Gemmatimonadota bacterium]|nr:nuclear transport factor 2 family protein [Gemmatimonadota bacterium]
MFKHLRTAPAERYRICVVAVTALALAGPVSCRAAPPAGSASDSRCNGQAEADVIRATERERLGALVSADLETARRLHADDFQLINPSGGSVSKEQYLGGIASGQVDYLAWEPESIAVRWCDRAAAIRYRSQLEIVVQGRKISRRPYWHTDVYEKRDGRWQVVWSQATEVK